jgi:CPA2 family monovalent cation:H+ antiporter-2
VEELRFFVDLGLFLLAALVGGLLAHQLRQPLIVGYLVGGILIGPFTPGPTISDPAGFRAFAEIGVVLLMFAIGAEFSPRDLLRAGRAAAYGAPLGIVLITVLTVPVGLILGWPISQGCSSERSSASPAPWYCSSSCWSGANCTPRTAG